VSKNLEIFFICRETDRSRVKKIKDGGPRWLYLRSLLSYMEVRTKGLFQDGIGFASRMYGERFSTDMDCKSSGLNTQPVETST